MAIRMRKATKQMWVGLKFQTALTPLRQNRCRKVKQAAALKVSYRITHVLMIE